MNATKRVTKEYAEVTAAPPAGIKVSLVDESNVMNWNIIMDGPADTPYVGGKFKLLLTLPNDYPFKAPTISFKTRIYHPNITNDEKGSMCIGILKADQWKPSSKIMSVLLAVQDLLREPVPDDALESGAAEKYKNDRAGYNKEAKDFTKKHAMK